MSDRPQVDHVATLLDAALALRRDAAFTRRILHEQFDAADPLQDVVERIRLAGVLESAATLPAVQRDAALGATVTVPDLLLLERLVRGMSAPSLHTDAAELTARRDVATSLRGAVALIQAVGLPLK